MAHDTMAELARELIEAVDEAIDAANSLHHRLGDAIAGICEAYLPAGDRETYGDAVFIRDVAERALIDLKRIRERDLDAGKEGLQDFDFSDIEDLAKQPEDDEGEL